MVEVEADDVDDEDEEEAEVDDDDEMLPFIDDDDDDVGAAEFDVAADLLLLNVLMATEQATSGDKVDMLLAKQHSLLPIRMALSTSKRIFSIKSRPSFCMFSMTQLLMALLF